MIQRCQSQLELVATVTERLDLIGGVVRGVVSGHKRTNSIPSSVRRTSEAGHSGRDRVVRRSWTKLSNSGLKSSSTLPAQHLGGEGGRGREGGREGGRDRDTERI